MSLQTAINNVRNYYNLPTVNWEFPCVSGKTNVAYFTYHVINLRLAIDGIIEKINGWSGMEIVAPIYWIPLENSRPKAAIMKQIKQIILSL